MRAERVRISGETDLATHELHSSPDTCHWGYFDSQLKPALRIKSGDVATIHCLSGSKEILPNKPPLNILPDIATIRDFGVALEKLL